MKLEAVLIGVSDVDRAKGLYESLDWRTDADAPGDDGDRVVQLTPPGSKCSIKFGSKLTSAAPGAGDLLVAVTDIEARVAGRDPQGRSCFSVAPFDDPDGNRWVLQELTTRLPGRRAPWTCRRSQTCCTRRPNVTARSRRSLLCTTGGTGTRPTSTLAAAAARRTASEAAGRYMAEVKQVVVT
jgi:catechol 2,3-dioxygenase-like lactoylglutathione lyase family enzyme